jgi:diguanylate cyclase (GGDEF)-like protein/PAS domain S-box-containing protein
MNEGFYQNLLDNLFDGVFVVDLERRITYWNKAASDITGYTQAEMINSSCSQHILQHIGDDGNELCNGDCPLRATLKDGKTRENNIFLHHKLGHRVPVAVRVYPLYDENHQLSGAVEIFADITERYNAWRELERLRQAAYIDDLTQVGNRRLGEVTLQAKLYEFKTLHIPFGVLFVDIDHFKEINDVHGHKIGDQVLQMVGKTIANILRKNDVVIRWGGEEFIVILSNVQAGDVHESAERIRVFIEKSFIMQGDLKIAVTVSIGASMALGGDTIESLIQRADGLMYQSKQLGRNRVSFG